MSLKNPVTPPQRLNHYATAKKAARNGRIFKKFSYLSIFLKSVEKIHVSFKSDKKNGYFT
jgi:hypothetical protein